MNHPIPQTAGIDIAKDRLNVCLCPNGAARHFTNDAKGHRALIVWLATHPIQRVVFEATRAYHRALKHCLAAAGLPLAKINPRHARRFAQALGQLAKKAIGSMQPCWRALERCSSRRPGLCSLQPWMR